MAKLTFKGLERLGRRIDAAADGRDAAALTALDAEGAERCETLTATAALGASLWYFRSNIHAALQEISAPRTWDWRQPNRERQILYLRRAAGHPSFIRLQPVVQAAICTNLANSLSSLGRSLEAVALYDDALKIVPNFAMALGNKGMAMKSLLPYIPDPGHARLIGAYACRLCRAANSPNVTWLTGNPAAEQQFADTADQLAKKIDIDKTISRFPLDRPSLGATPEERAYRRWVLAEGLFLNPLLMLGPRPIAAADRLNLPSHMAPIGDPPEFISWFNQMKQEFVGARWFLYDARRLQDKHFADKHVGLVNTLDYPAFGLRIEQLRAAFRLGYGLLDKIAGFINAYYGLWLEATRVDIRNIWHEKKGVIRTPFIAKSNLQLRGLYWLAQDIVGDDPADQDSIAPEASHLKKLRNLLEHRCLVLREMDLGDPMGAVETETLHEFQASTFRIFRLARAALMYLAFSMKQEERARRKEGEFAPAMRLPDL